MHSALESQADDRQPPAVISREIADTVVQAMSEARAVALLGPRQAGKSTLAQMLAADPLPAEYVTLDDERVRALASGDPQGFVAGLGRRTVIDEIQLVQDRARAVARGVRGPARRAWRRENLGKVRTRRAGPPALPPSRSLDSETIRAPRSEAPRAQTEGIETAKKAEEQPWPPATSTG